MCPVFWMSIIIFILFINRKFDDSQTKDALAFDRKIDNWTDIQTHSYTHFNGCAGDVILNFRW